MDKLLFTAKRFSQQTREHLRAGFEDAKPDRAVKLNRRDKRFVQLFLVIAAVVTVLFWYIGGRNLFIFPAMLCIAAVLRKYHLQRVK